MLKTLYEQSIHNLEMFILLYIFRAKTSINYHIILIKMSTDFKSRLIAEYFKDF